MKKELTWTQWEMEYAKAAGAGGPGGLGDMIGFSPSGAAEELSISRQRVHQLVNDGKLDQLTILDKNGAICATFITNNSVAAYKLSDRKPGRRTRKRR